jgi:hypothetical protein
MCQITHRHSIFCILPPYVLRSIAQNGTPQQRAIALKTVAVDHTFRALRAISRPATGAQRQPRARAEGQKQRTIYVPIMPRPCLGT